jgi:hypothetical protein
VPRAILIFTLITAIFHSYVQGKPNTYWSKRSGHQELSNQIHKDESQYLSETKEIKSNSKPLSEFQILPFSTILQKIKIFVTGEAWFNKHCCV